MSAILYDMEYPFGEFWSAIPAMSPLNLSPNHSPLAFGAQVGGGWTDSFDAV